MSCNFDLKEYALGEAAPDRARRIEAHAAACESCRDELSRLQLTRLSLLALSDEEMPRRIAFVSDKVFEPRWYARLWNSAPQLGFLAAAMLACAIVIHAFAGAAPPPPPVVTAKTVDTRALEQRIQTEVDARIHAAVTKAVAESDARQQQRTVELLQAADRRYEFDRRSTLSALAEQTRILERQVSNMYVATNHMKAGE